MIRSRTSVHCLLPAVLCFLAPAFAQNSKLTEDERIEILRGLSSEYATVKALLPRSPKPLPYFFDGTWNKDAWTAAGQKYGPAARLGDRVQITKVTLDTEKIVFEINNGMKGQGHWYDHIQGGMGGGMGGGVTPVGGPQNSSAPSGTTIALIFDRAVPAMKASEVKKMLAPILDFETESATENYVEHLPEPVQNAIKANKAIEGMDRDQVLLAIGKPRHKERNTTKDGVETEDWIYGEAPGKITFVTFTGSKVSQVKEAYADLGGSTVPRIVR